MATTLHDGAKFLEEQVRTFRELRPTYEVMARLLLRILTQAKRELDIPGVVQTRTKDVASFAEKAIRKCSLYVDPVRTMNDLCGGRIITLCKDDIDPMCEVLQRRLRVVEGEDALERLAATEFGYRSVHFVVSFDRVHLEELLNRLSDDEFCHLLAGFHHKDWPTNPKRRRTRLCDILCEFETGGLEGNDRGASLAPTLVARPRFRAEIQIRSSLQHAWAEFSHDRFYKSGFPIPARWQRMISRIAAALEAADDDFARTTNSLNEYRTYYGAYMSRTDREKELTNLQAILEYDPENPRLATRVSRIAISLEKFRTAGTTLYPIIARWEKSPAAARFKRLWRARARHAKDPERIEAIEAELQACRDQQISDLLTDYGWSKWRLGSRRGRTCLQWAATLDPKNVSARLFLAETHFDRGDEKGALECYSQAFKLAPTNPDVLGGLLFCKLVTERSTDSLATLRTSLETAIEHCRERIRANIDLPHVFYRMGMFLLFLGNPYEGLNAYARGVVLSESEADIARQYDRVGRLHEALRGSVPELEWAHQFLQAARTARLLRDKGQLARQVEQIQREVAAHASAAGQAADADACKLGQQGLAQLEEKLARARQRLAEVSKQAARLVRECRNSLQERCRAQPPELLEDRLLKQLATEPVMMVAGGCAQKHEERILSHRAIFESAFGEYRGILFSGCTDAGVNKLVGDLRYPSEASVCRIAYVPQSLPSWARRHDAFNQVVMTGAERFNALDPIMMWIHVLGAGRNPSDVKVLGINGGPIAAFEFRMALAMGAQVGILSHSGRAATEICADMHWKNTPGLLRLPTDRHTLRLFVCGCLPCQRLAPHREELAKAAHQEYRENRLKELVNKGVNVRDWEDLPLPLKESNRKQVDFIEEALKIVGLTINYVGVENKERIGRYRFRKEDEDKLAELEHARWNVERLLAGWQLGPKDVENKTTPYLVAWPELSPSIKEYDYDVVRAIPEKLRSVGYEIVDPRQGGPHLPRSTG